MTKKFVVLLALLIIFVPVYGVFAQDFEALPACSAEEITATIEGITLIDESVGEVLAEFDLSADPTDNEYGGTLVVLETLARSYWIDFFPVVPQCAEALGVAYVVGDFYEEYLITGLIYNLAAWAEAAGEGDIAVEIAAQGDLHYENLEFMLEAMNEMTLEELVAEMFADELPACSTEELDTAGVELMEAFEGMTALEEELADDPIATFVAMEAITYLYETEIYWELASCSELVYVADQVSIVLGIGNSVAGLYANAAIEEAAGNTEIAALLNEAAVAREELLDEIIAMME